MTVAYKGGWGKNSAYRYGENGAKGDRGEDFVEQYLINNNIAYERKTDRHSQVELKIDFTVENTKMDVKTNIFRNFLCVEVRKADSSDGWVFTSTAEEIYGVDLDNKKIYRYNLDTMRQYVLENKHRYKITKNNDTVLWVHVDTEFVEKLL